MTLADLIIEHGPFTPGDVILASFASQLLRVGDLNELRDELIAARKAAERREKIFVDIDFWNDEAHLGCLACGTRFCIGIDADETLGDLDRRADEHTEECR